MIPQMIYEWINRLIQEAADSEEVIEAEIVEEHEVKLLSSSKKIDIYA